ncbi:TonB-dependent receptor [Formosa sp. PL04]|uniref:SusC/RagA family TonB-linked outer membrane protein n=1 Tax=Formosa sp. PL04 TaxID=3081755 RepID=UPI0029811AAA|nr:TonB-dependent receptor [Formosa sp. PL04]MDW5290118.1 TonB-dependent receptor [Formosa sp. PL04]
MKKLCTFILLVFSSLLYAQNTGISGTIKDNTGMPLAGATVILKGTAKGAVTDFDGEFTIDVPDPIASKKLEISFIGYKGQTVTLNDKTRLYLTLEPDNESLDEIVVVGYGTVKKSDLTGSVSTIKAEEIAVNGAVGLGPALAGRAPGVLVTSNSGEPGSGASIRIRAVSSLNGSEPLYVIDGIPMDNTNTESLSSNFQSDQVSPLSMINPADVESVEILKDASSTAIYGSRGANGVVLITTKKGKTGKGVITILQEFGITEVANYIDIMDGNEYYQMGREAYVNAGNILSADMVVKLDSARAGQLRSTDWQKSIMQTGYTSNTDVSFSGGNEDVRYLMSTNYLDVEGVIPGSGIKRASTRVNVTGNMSKKFKVTTNINYTQTESGQTNNAAASRALRVSPLNGASDYDDGTDETLLTPATQISSLEVTNLMTQFLGSLTAEYDFTDYLSFKMALSHQNRNSAQRYYQYNRLPENAADGGRARTSDNRTTASTITNTLNFNKNFGKSNLNAVLGQSTEDRETEGIRVSNFGFANDLLTWYDPGAATFYDPDQVSYIETKLLSFFGRVNYSINNKYLFTLTGRYDGASKFAENKKWAFFPAAAFAYKISNENFMKEIEAISEMKLRLSYGTSGNQAIAPYKSLDQYESNLVGFNEQTFAVYYQNQLPSPDLTWETTTQLDVGMDFGFLKNKFTLSLDYYRKVTDDLLFPGIDIPVQSGQYTKTQNYGSLETNGFEVAFNARIISTNKFTWTLNGNLSTGKTKVKDMAADYLFSGWDPGFISGGTQRLIIGEEVGTFFGYKTDGISQFDDFVEFQGVSDEDRIAVYNANPAANYTYVDGYNRGYSATGRQRPGEQLYEDVTEDGTITGDDRRVIGQAQPDLTFGINNSFTFGGGFDFSFFIDSQLNKDLVLVQNYGLLDFNGSQGLDVVLNRWTPENPSTTYPTMNSGNGNVNVNLFSDRIIEDGSFVRLQNITLGFSFPNDLTNKLKISSLRVYASATNIAMWTNYTGYSPDVSLNGSSATNLGHDNARYPASRLIRMGVNLKF